MKKVFGIDISKWQRGISLKRARAEDVHFAVLRAAWHLSKDSAFDGFYKEAEKNKLSVGAYLYTMAQSASDAEEEADFLIEKCLKGKKFELPIYIDIENAVQKNLSRAENTALVRAFCDRLKKAGYLPGVYASKSFFTTYLNDDDLKDVEHWVAQWNRDCTFDGTYGLWQFGGETNPIRSDKVAGRVCDQDYMLKDYPAIVREKGLNGFPKEKKESEDSKKASGSSSGGCRILHWQQAAIQDGFCFPRFGADGFWGDECESIASIALVRKSVPYKNLHLTRFAQQLLNVMDDGWCGDETTQAIRNYQHEKGLTEDGVIGLKTWRALLQ